MSSVYDDPTSEEPGVAKIIYQLPTAAGTSCGWFFAYNRRSLFDRFAFHHRGVIRFGMMNALLFVCGFF
jgi:hypothetical protein